MTRPRHRPIVISNEKNIEWMKENLGRRRMLQILGAAGATSLAGCGGGGGEPSPTATATDEPSGQDTPTATATEADDGGMETTQVETDTPTATPGETVETPAGEVEVSDVTIKGTTFENFEKFQINDWNAESGFLPSWQEMRLAFIPSTTEPAGAGFEGAVRATMHLLIESNELVPQDLKWTMNLREGINWGSGQTFAADDVINHYNILNAQVELGEQGESTLPLDYNVVDDHTIEFTLVPGNPMLRFYEALFQGNFNNPYVTHPDHHQQFIEGFNDATSNSERQSIFQDLFQYTIDAENLPDFATGPFIADSWNPSQMTFKSRADFPWGFDLNPVDTGFTPERIYAGARQVSIGEEQTEVNAAIGGERDYARVPNERSFQRLEGAPGDWRMFEAVELASAALYFSKSSKLGKKTEKARQIRQGAAFMFDAEQAAAVSEVQPAYEMSTGVVKQDFFDAWIGEDRFLDSWTDYGHTETSYTFPDKAEQKFSEAGLEKNKNGYFVDPDDGKPLAIELLTNMGQIEQFWGMTRPMYDNIVEQFNDMGFKATGRVEEGDRFETDVTEFNFDVLWTNSQTEVHPHPFFGFREDMGLGSRDGMPVGINSWDWRNGHRRVDVPMPVGNPDGQMTTMDWDQLVKSMVQIEDEEKMKTRARTLFWIMNQWMPGIFVLGLQIFSGLNVDVLSPQPSVEEFSGKLLDEMREPHTWLYASGILQPPN